MPYEPQPYASLSLDKYLFNQDKVNHPDFPDTRNLYLLGACAYDRSNNLLYIVEYRGEKAGLEYNDDYPIMHVFRIGL